MKSKTLYFLNYGFNIFADNKLLLKLSKFWNSYLEKNEDTTIWWEIYFKKGNKSYTEIDYEKRQIIHVHNSVCEITEINNLIRETIVKITARDGIIWLHCSAFKIKDKTILVVGNKGDGKTTMLLNTILQCKGKFVGNDQLPIFIRNNNVYCFSWRPDIKISIDYAKKIGIASNTRIYPEDTKVVYLVNNNIPYQFINMEKMTKRIGKNVIQPIAKIDIKEVENKISKIDYIFILSKEQKIYEIKNKDLLEYVENDPETILEYKLLNMEKYMPYWNKRIKSVKINPKAKKNNNKILQMMNNNCRYFSIGNRLEFTEVKKFIKRLLEGEV